MEKYYSKFNTNVLFYGLLGLTVFIILYPKFPLINIPGTYVAIRIEDFLISFVLLFWFVLNLSRLKYILSKPITQAFLVFWFIGLVSLVSGIFVTHTVVAHLGFLHWLRRIEEMSLFFVGVSALSNRSQLKIILKTFLLVTLVVVLYGLGQIYLHFPVISTTNREFSKGLVLELTPGARPNSTFAGHYDLAVYLSIVIIYLASMFFVYKNIISKILITVIGGISFLLLGFTAARVSFIATLVGVATFFWFTGKKILIIGLILAAVLVVGAVPELRHRLVATVTVNLLEGGGPKYEPAQLVPSPSPSPFEKGSKVASSSAAPATKSATLAPDIVAGEPVNTTELGVFRSYNIRLAVEWPRALAALLKNPILGTGYSSISIATDNDILRSLGETGLLGTLAFALIFLCLFRGLLRMESGKERLERFFVISALCAMIAVLITGLFIDAFEASKVASFFWILMGLAWSISHDYEP